MIEQRVYVSKNSTINEMKQDDAQLNHVMARLLAVSESYPKLKASDVCESTMENINQYEENKRRIRMVYQNDIVRKFNRHFKMFSSNMIASIFSFKSR